MAKKKRKQDKRVRTSVTIPSELRKQMDKLNEDVNWSRVATDAFQKVVDESLKKEETKTMTDLVEKLRVSKRESDSENYKFGFESGKNWVHNDPSYSALSKLWEKRQNRSSHDWETILLHPDSHFSDLLEWMYPDEGVDVTEFFEGTLRLNPELASENQFVYGFAEGALTVWNQAKDRI